MIIAGSQSDIIGQCTTTSPPGAYPVRRAPQRGDERRSTAPEDRHRPAPSSLSRRCCSRSAPGRRAAGPRARDTPSARWVSTATARVGAAAAAPSRRAGATRWTQSAAPRRSARSVPPTRAGAWPRTSTRAASTSRRLVTQAPLGAGLRTTRHSTVGADLTGGPGLA